MKEYDIFISYSRKDTEIANKICKALDEHKISYFIDRQGIGGGLEFPKILAQAIRKSKLFLFLASKNSYDSKFTQSEIIFAFNKKDKKNIVPYIIDDSTFPEELELTFSAINWRRMSEHPFKTTLINDILQLLGRETSTPEVLSTNAKIVTDQKQLQILDDPLPCNYQPSFPSVSSRFLLFDMAFANLAKQPNEDTNQGFMSLLASECLDLLEFLFLYAEHPDLEIRRVSLNSIFFCIESESTLELQNIANAFKQDISLLPSYFRDMDVFLFLFRKQVIGGTSPLTLVFTSPQCKTIFQSFPDDFWGIKGQKLFKESVPFGERGEQFQEYIIRLLGVYHRNNSFFEYVRSQASRTIMKLFDDMPYESPQTNLSQMMSTYPSIYDEQGHEVLIPTEDNYTVPLGHIQAEQMVSTEYCIYSTLPKSPYCTKSRALIDIPMPLVLNETGIAGVHYLKNRFWNTDVRLDNTPSDIPLNERILPGTFTKYPYIVASDFLEDKIIRLDFDVNRETFFILGDDRNAFLPPIKPLYFSFFTYNDLRQQLRCQIDDNNMIEVTLEIPVTGNNTIRFISLHRNYYYHHDEIVSIEDPDFRLSVWPTYRQSKEELNNYSVSIGCYRFNNNVRARFIRLDSLDKDVIVNWHQIDDIRFCEVGFFDAIQISVNDTQALLFPKFKNIGEAYHQLHVGIDFGSSSTRISYCKDNNFSPEQLNIHPGQVLNLNVGHNDMPYWRSELTEMRMVQEEGGEVALPPYLPTYEHSRLYIGLMRTTGYKNSDVTKSFCNQLVWILKNTIVETFGSYDISKVNICIPSCVSGRKTDEILNHWKNAFLHHFKKELLIEIVDGNLSLLHSIRAHGHISSRPSLILDVGKQYTNVAFFEAEHNIMLSNSYPIGIWNIWESELLDYQSSSKLFYLLMDGLKYDSNNEQFINEIEERIRQHADWMDFLFSKMPDYSLSIQRKLFDSYPDMRGIFFLFLAAIIWKVVCELELKTEKKPDNIILSGRGFMPFLCFMGEHDLKISIMALFSLFSQEHHQGMNVSYVNNTSAKADGAVLSEYFKQNPELLPLCDTQNVVRNENINIHTISDDFLSFVQILRQFDTRGLPLHLSHICDLFEQNALYGTRSLQILHRNDDVSLKDTSFWPLKGTIPFVIREIL